MLAKFINSTSLKSFKSSKLLNSSNLILLIILLICVSIITILYISQERYFYFWDFSNYSNQATDLRLAFKSSISEGIKVLRDSLPTDYNKIPCLPLVPFLLIFGDSRLVFILSCAIVYIVPFCLTMGVIATCVISVNPPFVFWSTAFLTLFIQQTWAAIFRGYPDLGAAVLMGLATLFYLKDIKLKIWWQIPLIGFLLGFAILFRRHFAYSVRAFFLVIIVQGLIILFWEKRQNINQCIRELIRYGIKIILVAISIVVTMLIISPDFFYKMININYRTLYSSYETSSLDTLLFFGIAYGWFTIFLMLIGYLSGIITGVVNYPNISFIILFGSVSVIQWSLFAKNTIHLHYSTHFTMFVVLGIATLIWVLKLKIKPIFRYLALTFVILFLTCNLLIGLTPLGSFDNLATWGISEENYQKYRNLFTISHPPFIRQDYQQFKELIQYLREITPNQEPVYIAASSVTLNSSLISEAESQLYGKENRKLRIIYSPDIDSRDFYPLRYFPQAQYVVVATPFQYHLAPEQQKVVEVMVDGFNENWELSQDFTIMPKSFNLENNVKVNIYQRIQPTSLKTIINTLKLIQEQIAQKPGGEVDWILGESGKGQLYFEGFIGQKFINIYGGIQEKSESLLYYGEIPEEVKLTAQVNQVDCSGFEGVSVQLTALNQDGDSIKTTENVLLSPNSSLNLSLSLQGENAKYLYLTFLSQPQHKKGEQTKGSCYVRLENLTLN